MGAAMKVLYDHQAFMQPYGGVSRYFMELICAMRELEGFEPLIPRFFSDNQYLGKKRTFITRRHFPGKSRAMHVLNRPISELALQDGSDLFHPTYLHPYFLPWARMPFVVTVHDMTHHIFGESDVRDDGTRESTRILCERAARIIAVSNHTKSDLCRYLGVSPEKVSVVHHATNLRYNGEPPIPEGAYLLYVGVRSGYKNFLFFVSAVARLLEQANLNLVCAGAEPFSRDEMQALRGLSLEHRVRHIPIHCSEQLASLYHFAEALCYPSLHEGFGMPLLEAFACDCPVVTSSTSSLPEIAAEAAEYFCPIDRESIVTAIERGLAPERRKALIAMGKTRLGRFSWHCSAEKTLEVYRAAV
jgi:glycosyltransferase involved in cell wall biosynthesis